MYTACASTKMVFPKQINSLGKLIAKLQLLFGNGRQFQEHFSSLGLVKASHSKIRYSTLFIISRKYQHL